MSYTSFIEAVADIINNKYPDIVVKYDLIAQFNLEELTAIHSKLAEIEALGNDPALSALTEVNAIKQQILDIVAEPLKQSILQANIDSVAINTVAGDTLKINDVASEPLRGAVLDVTSEPLRQSILDAEGNAGIATAKATEAQLKVWEAEAERMTADSYATEAEDMFVKTYTSNGDGTFTATDTAEYSAYHWKQKAAIVASGSAENISYDGAVSGLAATDVQDAIDELASEKADNTDVYTKTEMNAGQMDSRYYTETELNNGQLDSRYYTESEVDTALGNKQDTLVSGTNIKTVNGKNITGSGNLLVQETLVNKTNIKSVNGESLLGSGNLTIDTNKILSMSSANVNFPGDSENPRTTTYTAPVGYVIVSVVGMNTYNYGSLTATTFTLTSHNQFTWFKFIIAKIV